MQWSCAARSSDPPAAADDHSDARSHSHSSRPSSSGSSRHERRSRDSAPPRHSAVASAVPAASSSCVSMRPPLLLSGPYSPLAPLPAAAAAAAADPFAQAAASVRTADDSSRGSSSGHSSRASSASSSRSSSSPHPQPRKHRESRAAHATAEGHSTVRIDVAPNRPAVSGSAASHRSASSSVWALPQRLLSRVSLPALLPRAWLVRVPSVLARRPWTLWGLLVLAAAAVCIHTGRLLWQQPPHLAAAPHSLHTAPDAMDKQQALDRDDGLSAAAAVDPLAFVRQWHLAALGPLHQPIPRASASAPSSASLTPVSGLSVDTAGPPPLRWTPPDVPIVSGPVHPTCATPSNKSCVWDQPSAHRAGLGSYPSLSLSFTFAELRAALGDEPHFDLWFDVVPPPWLLRLTTHALRYDPDDGSFLLLLSFDDAYSHINAVRGLEEDACMGRSTAVRSRRLKLFLAMQGAITCAYSVSTAEPRVALLRSRGEVLELRCPWPSHPQTPPSELFHMDVTYGLASAAADLPPLRMRVPIESALSRRVQFALCVRTLTDPLALHALPDFLQHHAFMGVELFHVYDRYAQPAVRALLQPYMESGLVELHDAPEHTYAYQRGRPTDLSSFSHQAHAQEMCRYRSVQSARYVAMWDTDEYLYFPRAANVEAENTTLDYHTPNGIPVELDPHTMDQMTVPVEAPSCMERQWATGRLQPSYRELDRANAEADRQLGQLPHQLSASQRSSIEIRSLWSDPPAPLRRALHCTSMLSTLVARTFALAEPVLPAARLRTDPWFISLNLHVHTREWNHYSVAREEWLQSLPLRTLQSHSAQLKYRPSDLVPPHPRARPQSTGSVQRVGQWRSEDRQRRRLEGEDGDDGDSDEKGQADASLHQCGLPEHEAFRTRWTTPRHTAATMGTIVAQAQALDAASSSSSPASAPPAPPAAAAAAAASALSALPSVLSCFSLENFHYPLLLRYPWRALGFPINNPKFLLAPWAEAALKVHSASNATARLGAEGWSVMMRNRHRTAHDRKTEPPQATLHVPPIAVLLHFRNAHSNRHHDPTPHEEQPPYPSSPSVQFYTHIVEAIQRMPCSRGNTRSRSRSTRSDTTP